MISTKTQNAHVFSLQHSSYHWSLVCKCLIGEFQYALNFRICLPFVSVNCWRFLPFLVTLKYQISVPQVIRVPQQKSTLKTGQISWNNRSEDREIANYHSPIHCNSFTCQFKCVKVIFGEKNLRTTGNFGLELIKVPVLLFDTLE